LHVLQPDRDLLWKVRIRGSAAVLEFRGIDDGRQRPGWALLLPHGEASVGQVPYMTIGNKPWNLSAVVVVVIKQSSGCGVMARGNGG
jgi:hypothetical protein